MIIRKQQLDAFDHAGHPHFETSLVDHFQEFTPLHARTLGEDGLRTFIAAARERAARHGFTKRGPVRFYIETAVLFGIHFDDDPQYPWFAPLLDDPAIPDEIARADRVHEAVIAYLATVAGEDREYAIQSLFRVRDQPFEPASRSSPDFAERVIGRAEEIFPEKAARVGRPNLERLIARAEEEAQTWNAATDAGVCLFFGLMFSVGHGVVADPKYPWVAHTLAQPGYTPEKRVERLHSKTMTYLDHVLNAFSTR